MSLVFFCISRYTLLHFVSTFGDIMKLSSSWLLEGVRKSEGKEGRTNLEVYCGTCDFNVTGKHLCKISRP